MSAARRDPACSGPPASAPFFPPSDVDAPVCTTLASSYQRVQIHTAKCAICDARNLGTMLRCPGCTHQVCAPCVEASRGAALVHGNLAPAALGVPSSAGAPPSRRRMLFQRADRGEAESSPVSGTMGSAMGVTGGTAEGKDGKGLFDVVGAKVATPRRTGRKRSHKARTPRRACNASTRNFFVPRAVDGSYPSSSSSDADFVLGDEYSNQTSKRRKTVKQAKTGTTVDGVSEPAESLGQTARRAVNATTRSRRFTGGTAADKWEGDAHMQAREQRDDDFAVEDVSVVSPARGGSLQALLENAGVDTPGNRYQEHLLGRREVVTHNPFIGNAPAMPRPSAAGKTKEHIHQEIQRLTLLQWIDFKGAQFCHANNLTEMAEKVFVGTLTAKVMSLVANFNEERSPSAVCLCTYSERSTMDHFERTSYMNQLTEAAQQACEKTFEDLGLPGTPKRQQD